MKRLTTGSWSNILRISSQLVVMCAAAPLLSACLSLRGDIFINNQRTQAEASLAKVEAAIVPLEAAMTSAAIAAAGGVAAVRERQMITALEKEAAADADYAGRLTAWSGRLAILEGRYSEAMRLYRQSIAASPGNIPSIILGIRLEGDPSKRLEMIERELSLAATGLGELNIERARALLEMYRFSEAAGAFDVAFSTGLAAVYYESYAADRNRAWELRNTSDVSAGTLDMLTRDSLNWSACIAIAKNETQLLHFISGGRNIADTDLFNRLLERAFIPYTQDTSINEWPTIKPNANDLVTRAGAAWFIWHLYAEARANRGLLSRYSARYATGANPRSPIADIPPLSPFFDSILGCVETEFMSLPDGRSFQPARPIRGAELLTILKKIDN